jgi:hypothetical protein
MTEQHYQEEINRLIRDFQAYANRLRAILNLPDMPADRLLDEVERRLNREPNP